MKLISCSFLSVLLILCGKNCCSQLINHSSELQCKIQKAKEVNSNATFSNNSIGAGDSVFIDLAAAYQLSAFIDVPVYFRSSSEIFSLDFEVKYNEQRMLLDTLVVHCNNLQYLYYYNPLDSILRFTSNSLVPLDADSAILTLRFQVLQTPVCSNDITNAQTYLNGDQCSNLVSNCVILGISENASLDKFIIYPNPTNEEITIQSTANGVFLMFDLEGKQAITPAALQANQSATFNLSTFPEGIYIYTLIQANNTASGKLIISR